MFALQMLLFTCIVTNSSLAQNTLLAGRITDENNKPVAGAVIKVAKGKTAIETAANKDGLYYTKLLPAGKYHVSIYTGDKSYKANQINVQTSDKTKSFYNFKLTGNNAVTSIDEQDPFMAVAFEKIEANKHVHDFPPLKRGNHIKYEDLIIDGNGVWKIPDSLSFGK